MALCTKTVSYEKRDGVGYVTLNRPASLNALSLQMHRELGEIWDDFERDESLLVGVLTGAGEKAFSVGQDLKELGARMDGGEPPSSFGSQGKPGAPRLTERFGLTKPIIARVNGYALGGGFELALACDIIVASDYSTFGLPEARLGLIAGAGGVFRLTRQVSIRVAVGHLITGRTLSASRAYELGLVNEVVSAEKLDKAVSQWIDDILRCSPASVRAIKEVALKSGSLSIEEAFNTRYEWEEKRLLSKDWREGVSAFLEKRSPKWGHRG